jgi:uncharacterized protein (TIGR02145 family)
MSVFEKHFYVNGYEGMDVKEAKNTVNYLIYGVLYNWTAAMNDDQGGSQAGRKQGICPEGWHLPDDREWKELEIFLGMDPGDAEKITPRPLSMGAKLKSSSGWDDDLNLNPCGFNALPGGYVALHDRPNQPVGSAAYFQSSTEYSPAGASSRMLFTNNAVYRNPTMPKGLGQSVRCVKNNP